MNRKVVYKIKENNNESIETFLKKNFYSTSNISYLKKKEGRVRLNDKNVRLKTVLKKEDVLELEFIEEEDSKNIVARKLEFSIVYEDEDFIVVNKPSKMPIHPSASNFENTLANALMFYYKEKRENFVYRVINRLDKDTTGLVIVAKNMLSASILQNDMRNRRIKRKYLALVEDEKSLLEEGSIKNKIGRKEMSVIERCVDENKGKEAITHYKKVKNKAGKSLVKLELETGRTHQIRVHMSYIGFPLVGDYLYNEKYKNKEENRPLLHSYYLSFFHPITRDRMEFQIDLPKDMI